MQDASDYSVGSGFCSQTLDLVQGASCGCLSHFPTWQPSHQFNQTMLMIHSRVLQDSNGGVDNILETTGMLIGPLTWLELDMIGLALVLMMVMITSGPGVFTDAVEEFLQLRGLDLVNVINGALVDGLLVLNPSSGGVVGGGLSFI